MPKMKPFPTQIEGATFLASRQSALLADEPRVGKTGAAIIGADLELAEKVLVITTASGRLVWKYGFRDWSPFNRDVQVISKGSDALKSACAIVGWNGITNPKIRAMLLSRKWDRIISDEDHYAKSFEAGRTRALYGELALGGDFLDTSRALIRTADERVWTLTGTPQPNSPADWYPRLRALRPALLKAHDGMADVTKYEHFLHRYCVVKMKQISRFRKIPVVIGGRNLEELRARRGDFMLRRTQADVGIGEPRYDLLPLEVSPSAIRSVEGDLNAKAVLEAAQNGATKQLEMHLGPLRRLTGQIKAGLVVEAAKDEFECGLDKIVLAYWHRDVGDILEAGLSRFGVVRIDGSTKPTNREAAVNRFRDDKETRVCLAQIEAAGEAVDFSAAALLWFVEPVFSPRAMKQMSLRVTNHTQTRQVLVRVCVMAGSIDEALQASLLRKWVAIREVLA